MDTIFALSTARGKAGLAVVRVSGPQAPDAVQLLAGRLPEPRVATLRRLESAGHGHIDDALILLFAHGQSFTGEDVAEFHVHGGAATIDALLSALAAIPGLRPAEPGEFTRRALENEKLDLAQVEGLADLIEAETEAQRVQAARLLSGALGARADAWRSELLHAVALIEATIDFADEEVPVDVAPEVRRRLTAVQAELRAEAAGTGIAERIRDGFEVAIMGPPNIGKSTLLNMLAGRDAAITSEIAGTTRDVIEVRMDLGGLPVTLLDTAGLRDTTDLVEGIGIDRARTRAEQADIRVFLVERESEAPVMDARPDDIVAVAKADLAEGTVFGVSGKTGRGVDRLIEMLTERLGRRATGALTATRQRHRIALGKAAALLEVAIDEVQNGTDRAEFAAHELHSAIRALDSLVGRIDVEHILGEIFSTFCVGK